MTDFIANDDDGRWDADRVALFAETGNSEEAGNITPIVGHE